MTKMKLGPSNHARLEHGAIGLGDIKRHIDKLAASLISTMEEELASDEYKSLGEEVIEILKERLREDIKTSTLLAFKSHMKKQSHSLF